MQRLLPSRPSPCRRRSYVVRHGEKTWAAGCLSDAGERRASMLASVFNGTAAPPAHGALHPPSLVFANRYGDPIDCQRCVQTASPIAKQLGLVVNDTYGFPRKFGGNEAAASAIASSLSGAACQSRTPCAALVVWEHVNIRPLVLQLGADPDAVPHRWASDDFDTVSVCGREARSGFRNSALYPALCHPLSWPIAHRTDRYSVELVNGTVASFAVGREGLSQAHRSKGHGTS